LLFLKYLENQAFNIAWDIFAGVNVLHQLQSLDASNFAKNIKIPPITCYDQAMQQEVKFWINYVKLQLEQQSIYLFIF
jgi:hypothetical protein